MGWMMALPDGLLIRAPALEDAEAIAALIATCEQAEGDEPSMSAEELRSAWWRMGTDLNEDAVIVTTQEGETIGYADVDNRGYILVTIFTRVHPGYLHQGIMEFLTRWGESWAERQMEHAPESARVEVQQFARSTNQHAREHLEQAGYQAVRTDYWMTIDMEESPPSPEWPEGVAVRTFVAGQDEQTIFEVGEETFQDIWGRAPSTYERWIAPTRQEGFDPTL
jgi:hypothetical protein